MDAFREEIKGKLTKVSHKARVLFAAIICEKLYPHYLKFVSLNHWGNSSALDEGIAAIRQYLVNDNLFDNNELLEIINQVEENTPNTEEFPGIITSFALDACTSISETLNYLLDKEIDHIADVATYARDTVDMYIQERDNLDPNDGYIEEKIANDPEMKLEKRRQFDLLEKLSILKIESVTDNLFKTLNENRPIIKIELLFDI